jgi:hypothetical protein
MTVSSYFDLRPAIAGICAEALGMPLARLTMDTQLGDKAEQIYEMVMGLRYGVTGTFTPDTTVGEVIKPQELWWLLLEARQKQIPAQSCSAA